MEVNKHLLKELKLHSDIQWQNSRLHGTIRDMEKVMREMQTSETAQKVVDAMRIHYNYIRVHSILKKHLLREQEYS
jgi:hypothetical protein